MTQVTAIIKGTFTAPASTGGASKELPLPVGSYGLLAVVAPVDPTDAQYFSYQSLAGSYDSWTDAPSFNIGFTNTKTSDITIDFWIIVGDSNVPTITYAGP